MVLNFPADISLIIHHNSKQIILYSNVTFIYLGVWNVLSCNYCTCTTESFWIQYLFIFVVSFSNTYLNFSVHQMLFSDSIHIAMLTFLYPVCISCSFITHDCLEDFSMLFKKNQTAAVCLIYIIISISHTSTGKTWVLLNIDFMYSFQFCEISERHGNADGIIVSI